MAIIVKKRDGESPSALAYRFSRKVKRSGVLREARARRFHPRNINRNGRRRSALYRNKRKEQIDTARKLGNL